MRAEPDFAGCVATADRSAVLARFNVKWEQRMRTFRRRVPPPWWGPGLRIDPELRRMYELYLPVAEFLHDLAAPARQRLPHAAWIPRPLQPDAARPGRFEPLRGRSPQSLPDLWQTLPSVLAGRVSFGDDELLPLLCALAAPRRFGTGPGRYPVQLNWLRRQVAGERPGTSVRFLDLGCGNGEGTREIAALLAAAGCPSVHGVGVTREPLEAWVAAQQCDAAEPATGSETAIRLHFIAANLLRLPLRQRFPIVVCNGVVGGDFLQEPEDAAALVEICDRVLEQNGSVFLANRFHAGTQARLQRLQTRARNAGWDVHGTPNCLQLKRLRPATAAFATVSCKSTVPSDCRTSRCLPGPTLKRPAPATAPASRPFQN